MNVNLCVHELILEMGGTLALNPLNAFIVQILHGDLKFICKFFETAREYFSLVTLC